MSTESAARLRRIRTLAGAAPDLDLDALPERPEDLFGAWLAEALAAEVPEPIAVTLATVDADGVPDARTLLLKDVDARGWAFSSTASSRKAEQLEAYPAAAMNVYWIPVARAIRVRGPVEAASEEECEADLAGRSPAARALVAPGDWRVWRIVPDRVEFWQGSEDRDHLRLVYTRVGGGIEDARWSIDVSRAAG
ncbi:pyridoxamine 5'-phosphate oxidase family protein [Mobilicoccus pelagius]|uniref:Pyridoxine/pyridoxamine 5'-phosphate oxidase n=1 Tax=Mobilicoccus pelagius NBRC 104925 TaxID=1089455 RepID=H5UV69_9MICO|nr:pyridoxamine 5'-phosphate oxidase family protein [Mobilicoccus pelagius]GAB49627.1 pyridoxine/pyridoxamine 5'-phosphate oxidase [Mobilicoccus pelagius NBRC 104925]